MRIAIVSDIHGNRTAFEAVLADLKLTSPDLVFHGCDLADSGASPVEIVDRIRDLGWQGVAGNTDEMLFRPESLREFAKDSQQMQPIIPILEEMAAATRDTLGEERLHWLSDLPRVQIHDAMALVHGSPETLWRAPAPEADDASLESTYGLIARSVVVYGHIHRPFIRNVGAMTVVNTGSVSLSYDGDQRASYLLLDDGKPTLRRVVYALNHELRALAVCGLPHAGWIARTLQSARPQMP